MHNAPSHIKESVQKIECCAHKGCMYVCVCVCVRKGIYYTAWDEYGLNLRRRSKTRVMTSPPPSLSFSLLIIMRCVCVVVDESLASCFAAWVCELFLFLQQVLPTCNNWTAHTCYHLQWQRVAKEQGAVYYRVNLDGVTHHLHRAGIDKENKNASIYSPLSPSLLPYWIA